MGYKKHTNTSAITALVSEYEALAQNGGMAFFEEKAFLQLIDYYEQEFMLDRALEVADHGLIHHHFSSDLYLRKAVLLLHCRREEDALDLLEQAEVLSPSDLQISLLRAEVLAHLGLYNAAMENLEELKDWASAEDLSAIFQVEAIVYEQQEQYERMFYALQEALKHNPTNEQALERIWVCVTLSKKYKESVDLHNRLLERDAYSYLAWYNLGQSYAYLSYYEEAIEAYEFSFLLNEKFEPAYRDYAEICFELHRYAEAVRGYKAMREHFDLDTELSLRLGQCYLKLNDVPKARYHLHRTAKVDALNDEVFFTLGELYAAEGNWRKAITFYQKAIDIEYCREDYFAALAKAHTELGQLEEAVFYWQEATQAAPEQIEYWFLYANFLITLGEVEEAYDVLDSAEEWSDCPELAYCRVACLFQAGERQEALNLLAITLEESEEDGAILFDLLPHLRQDREVLAILSSFQ